MSWLLGIGLELGATFAGTAGKQLIRYSTIILDDDPDADSPGEGTTRQSTEDMGVQLARPETVEEKEAAANIAFKIGLFFQTLGAPLLEMSAYAFAAQSTLAPFGGLDTVWNALLAPYTLGETLTTRRLTGVCVIITGTVFSAIFANHEVLVSVQRR